MVIGHATSGAEALAAKVPGADVISAFSTVPSEVLFSVLERRKKGSRPDLVYCGDDKGAKKTAAGLIRDAGFQPVDMGPLSTARYTEPFSLLLRNMPTTARSPELAYRVERFPS